MRVFVRILLLVAGVLSLGLGAAVAHAYWPSPLPPQQRVEPAAPLLIDRVTVVDVETGALTPDQSVLITDGRIVEIAPADQIGQRPGLRRIEASGQFLVPGYNNMHSHILTRDHPEGGLALMLAEGVTGFRQMDGDDRLLRLRSESRLPLNADTPALLATSGPFVTPLNVASPEDAAAWVISQKRKGADFIKVGATTPPLLYAMLATARDQSIPVVGHLPEGVDPVRASEDGFHSIEHLGPGDTVWIGCSADKARLMADAEQHPSVAAPPFPIPGFARKLLEPFVKRALGRQLLNPAAFDKPEDVQRLQAAFDSYQPEQCRALAQTFARNDTWVVPTLVRLRTQYLQDDPEYRTDPLIPYLEPRTYRAWTDVAERFAALPQTSRQTFREGYERSLALTALLADADVSMMTGTDGSYHAPGLTMAQEFHELARAGLSPLKILQMTTRDPARFLGRTDTMGSVTVGKAADLVLLSDNPLTDVAHLERITGVIRAGHYHSSDDLARLKDRIAAGHGRLE